jgi:diadenosine tetraphosphate (Ap4A) HIT family hydrolase
VRGRGSVTRIDSCLACDLSSGRVPLPGGLIYGPPHWLVEHCIGPLGVGTLVVKARRHVVRVSELEREEAEELGDMLRLASAAVDALVQPDQVYVTLWAHAGGTPVHIHWVVQPVTRELMASHDNLHGPKLQVAMFERNEPPPGDAVEAAADSLRGWFAEHAAASAT